MKNESGKLGSNECYIYVRTRECADEYFRYVLGTRPLAEDWSGPEIVHMNPLEYNELLQRGEASVQDFCTAMPYMVDKSDEQHPVILSSSEMVVNFINNLVRLFDVRRAGVLDDYPRPISPRVLSQMVRRTYTQFADVLKRFGIPAKVLRYQPVEHNGMMSSIKTWYSVAIHPTLSGLQMDVVIDFLNTFVVNSYSKGDEVNGVKHTVLFPRFMDLAPMVEDGAKSARPIRRLSDVRWRLHAEV